MKAGFAHFDACHTENFAAAMLCLLVEVEDEARNAFVRLVAEALDLELSGLGPMLDVAREDRLDAEGARAFRRADVGLRFREGPVLVEVKTHGRWSVDGVVEQLADQRASTRLGRPLGVVLLAPTGLAARVARRGEATLRWSAVTSRLRAIDRPLVRRAVQHLEVYVERSFGIDSPVEGFERSVQVVSCLRELLAACARDIGERPDMPGLNLTGWDGGTFASGEWRWHCISVPLRGNVGRRVGIYRYTSAPPDSQAALEDAWLELYLEDPDQHVHYVRFAPPDLTSGSLDAVREEFREVWAERKMPTGAASGGQ